MRIRLSRRFIIISGAIKAVPILLTAFLSAFYCIIKVAKTADDCDDRVAFLFANRKHTYTCVCNRFYDIIKNLMDIAISSKAP